MSLCMFRGEELVFKIERHRISCEHYLRQQIGALCFWLCLGVVYELQLGQRLGGIHQNGLYRSVKSSLSYK